MFGLCARRAGRTRGRSWTAVAGSVLRSAAAGCWLAALLIMSVTAWFSGHGPANGVLATLAAALVVGADLSLRTPAGWCQRRRDGRRDRNRVHGHDHLMII